jgi:hypothetical protein
LPFERLAGTLASVLKLPVVTSEHAFLKAHEYAEIVIR